MALELNGTTGVSLVQDGVVTADDLASGAITSAALPAGSVLQVARNTGTGGNGSNSTTFVTLTDVAVTITPKRTDSILIVQFFATAYVDGGDGFFSITRDGTLIGSATLDTMTQMNEGPSGAAVFQPSALSVYVTSGSTNSTTFKVAVRNNGGNTFFPAGSVDQWTAYVLEVAV